MFEAFAQWQATREQPHSERMNAQIPSFPSTVADIHAAQPGSGFLLPEFFFCK
jgi:hypothetical protein